MSGEVIHCSQLSVIHVCNVLYCMQDVWPGQYAAAVIDGLCVPTSVQWRPYNGQGFASEDNREVQHKAAEQRFQHVAALAEYLYKVTGFVCLVDTVSNCPPQTDSICLSAGKPCCWTSSLNRSQNRWHCWMLNSSWRLRFQRFWFGPRSRMRSAAPTWRASQNTSTKCPTGEKSNWVCNLFCFSEDQTVIFFMYCALCIVHCALCIVHCALCIVHCALCIVHQLTPE